MPVVNIKSNLYNASPVPDPARARGRPVVAQFSVSNLSTDSALSKYLLASLPSDCILAFNTWFKVDGWGFATVNIGTKTTIAALGTVARATGTYFEPVVRGDSKHGKYLWEVLGLAADPGVPIDIYAQGPADATVAGVMTGEFAYRVR